ncbi:MAG: hypothetical protein MJE77_35810 [Proteobacteria bacterium]|nr:hypothetical protein [Pseudomonadota bacterium]
MRTVFASLITALAVAVITLALGFAVPVGVAHAQSSDQGTSDAAQKKVKTYDFSGDTIDGDLLKPDGDIVDTRRFASHTSLIRIRKNFIKEILKSAEDL